MDSRFNWKYINKCTSNFRNVNFNDYDNDGYELMN